MALKASRTGFPGDLVIKLGSQEGASDIGIMRLKNTQVYASQDLPYTLKLGHPVNLDPKNSIGLKSPPRPAPRRTTDIWCTGPRPLAGEDYRHSFGLSFRMLTADEE